MCVKCGFHSPSLTGHRPQENRLQECLQRTQGVIGTGCSWQHFQKIKRIKGGDTGVTPALAGTIAGALMEVQASSVGTGRVLWISEGNQSTSHWNFIFLHLFPHSPAVRSDPFRPHRCQVPLPLCIGLRGSITCWNVSKEKLYVGYWMLISLIDHLGICTARDGWYPQISLSESICPRGTKIYLSCPILFKCLWKPWLPVTVEIVHVLFSHYH